MNAPLITDYGSDKNRKYRFAFLSAGIIVNVALSYVLYKMGLPLFLDTVGTICVAAISGQIYGIACAVATNALCLTFNSSSFYFSIVHALIAAYTAWFFKRYRMDKVSSVIAFSGSTAVMAGALSSVIQWWLFGDAQHTLVADTTRAFALATNLPYFSSFCITNILVNIVGKSLACLLVLLVVRLLPQKAMDIVKTGWWMQRPLTDDEIKSVKAWERDIKSPMKERIAYMLVASSLVLVVATTWICLHMYYANEKAEKTETALNVAKFVSSAIDADKVDDYLQSGESAPGYMETKKLLENIRSSASGVEYLYVVKLKQDGCYFVFDLDTEEEPGYLPGEKVEFEEALKPYLNDLFKGKEIEPIESDDLTGWLLTAYYPIKDSQGNCVAYAGADVSLGYMAQYLRDFVLKIGLIMSGVFIIITAYILWATGIYTAYPISAMASSVDRYTNSGGNQERLDENVRAFRSLNIHTGDEVEKLYHAICRMTLNQAEQMRSIRHLSDSTAKMQDGLIITMADMVESRDSDTGAHVQKTAAYVKIIAEGLKRKGYYASKVDNKFISDVVRSAPLHDVGKINISDAILNKPGKLTDEEYEIMKTHTTAGKKILENAISTIKGENYLKEARNMAAYHHERWDGKGYPEGLHGEVIPLAARIMSVADVFDALTSPRVYKPAFPLDKALAIIEEGSGTQFDPKVVEVFMESLPEVKVILKKYNQ
ncbi:MAG: HD domain-containing protein [Lachnospiraceae bacterium]|nr:HD domain-containing protein [Lachnospiraceae bacterium]